MVNAVYFDKPSLLDAKWKCDNTEPLGVLWMEMLRFYTVELKYSEVIVCVRQRSPMKRTKEWPGNRLAIEREVELYRGKLVFSPKPQE